MWILLPTMAFLAIISLGCLSVRNSQGFIPAKMAALAMFFGFGALTCVYLLLTVGGGN